MIAINYGWFSYLWFSNATRYDEPLPMALVSFLILVPLGVTAISLLYPPNSTRSLLGSIGFALTNVLLFLLIAVISNPVILFCVALALPFILIPMILFVMFQWLFNKILPESMNQKRKRHYIFTGFMVLLPFIAAPIEAGMNSPNWIRTVEDSVIIDAPTEVIWQNIIRMETITEEEQRPSWYHTMGVPRPIRAELDTDGIGAVRMGYFEDGLVFREEITEWIPNERITFNVDVEHNEQSTPVTMQIGGAYFDIREAGYTLTPLADGRTKLTLYSEYRLSTNFNFYAVFWSDWIMHDFQTYVLDTVEQRLAESK